MRCGVLPADPEKALCGQNQGSDTVGVQLRGPYGFDGPGHAANPVGRSPGSGGVSRVVVNISGEPQALARRSVMEKLKRSAG